MRLAIGVWALAFLFLLLLLLGRGWGPTAGPNVLLVTVDQEPPDLGSSGARVATPHLDRLAREGVRFRRCTWSGSTCSVSRYSVLTGRYESRSTVMQRLWPPGGPVSVIEPWAVIGEDEATVAHALRRAGYRTGTAGGWPITGSPEEQRWHLFAPGDDPADPRVVRRLEENQRALDALVLRRGFDSAVNVYAEHNASGLPRSLQTYNPEWIDEGAVAFLRDHGARPFFLHVAYECYFSRESLSADRLVTPFGRAQGGPCVQPSRKSVVERSGGDRIAAAAIWLDDSVGALLRTLDELGLAERTLVVFMTGPRHEDRRRDGRPTTHSLIVRWTGQARGGTVVDNLVSPLDVVPTILDACGVRPPLAMKLDGRSLLPFLSGKRPSDWRRSLLLEGRDGRTVVTDDGWEYVARLFPPGLNLASAANFRASLGTRHQAGARAAPRPQVGARPVAPPVESLLAWNDPGTAPRNLALDPENRERLRALRRELEAQSAQLPHPLAAFPNRLPTAGADRNDAASAGAGRRTSESPLHLGQELFTRKWTPHDPRCHGGDGLGPFYNADSCVSCHHQGGTGGSGPIASNVTLLNAPGATLITGITGPGSGALVTRLRFKYPLIHPSLQNQTSIVLHRYGTDPRYETWRTNSTKLESDSALGRISFTSRNPPALFGAGLIDSIPDDVIRSAATVTYSRFPRVAGRVSRLPDGRIGRFGWKGQVATLREFVLTACAGELGLEVPGHHQAISPLDPGASAPGLDMTEEEGNALVAYVASLPPPGRLLVGWDYGDQLRGGLLFKSIGCAACHTPTLGHVEGIYSDLLLHVMGPALADDGGSYGPLADTPSSTVRAMEDCVSPQAWRTPPLWGLRDSSPYMHDGNSSTIEEAIARHGGEAEESARRFAALPTSQQHMLVAFLSALVAPAQGPGAP
jgi:CxxC motif-containing protein (DUF1111 family)